MFRKHGRSLAWILAGALTLPVSSFAGTSSDRRPTGKGGGTRFYRPASSGEEGPPLAQGANGIYYHGGSILLGTVNLYLLLYGAWSPAQIALLQAFGSSIGGSPYFNIETTYYDGSGNHIANSVSLRGTAIDDYSHGKSLTDAGVGSVLQDAIAGGKLPLDRNGIYLILTSADVAETSGFCTSYCGWHTGSAINGTPINYAFVGNAERCMSACAEQTTSPNHLPGVDGMISIIAHELDESVNDPGYTAWYDNSSEESGDKCQWTFGKTYATKDGSKANVTLGGKEYLIQQNWVNADGGYCAMQYP